MERDPRLRRYTVLRKLGTTYVGGAQQYKWEKKYEFDVRNSPFCSGSLLQCLILVFWLLQKCDVVNKQSGWQWITSAIVLVVFTKPFHFNPLRHFVLNQMKSLYTWLIYLILTELYGSSECAWAPQKTCCFAMSSAKFCAPFAAVKSWTHQ